MCHNAIRLPVIGCEGDHRLGGVTRSDRGRRLADPARLPPARLEPPPVSGLLRAIPANLRPDPERRAHGFVYGMICMSLMLLTGVTGPLLDMFFLGAKTNDRRGIVATKATAQVLGHGFKLAYFGGLAAGAAFDVPAYLYAAYAHVGKARRLDYQFAGEPEATFYVTPLDDALPASRRVLAGM